VQLELRKKEQNVQQHDNDVDPEQMNDGIPPVATSGLNHGLESSDGFVDVNTADDGILHAEAGDLDAIVYRGGSSEACVALVQAKLQDGHGDVKNEKVSDDHPQHPPHSFHVAYNKIQTGIEYDRLTSDHGVPPDDEWDGRGKVRRLRDKTSHGRQCMHKNAPRRDLHAPEIETAVALERVECDNCRFEGVVCADREHGHDLND
jgi:hypothetical protein